MLDGNTDMNTLKDMIIRGSEIKLQMSAMETELRTINAELAKRAQYVAGSKTGRLMEAGIKVTVSQRENVKWLQDRLMQVKEILPDQFCKAFVYEYKPATAKELKAAMEENEEFAKACEWARECKPGAPTVTYERIEDEGDIPF